MTERRETLRKQEILRGRTTLHQLLRAGGRVSGPNVTLFLPSARRRFGCIVPIKPFGGAIGRNYARRRLREFFRRNKHLFPGETDLLVRIYKPPDEWDRFLKLLTQLLDKVEQIRKREKNRN